MKDPAFLFYPGDWLSGTQWMTLEQKGCYMELLILQFNTGKFTEIQAKQVLSICFDLAWPIVKQKFLNEEGFYYNERLKQEIDKRKKFTESRRLNGSKPKNESEKKETQAKHMDDHMENENRNENINYNRIVNNYNTICKSLSKIEKLSDTRKTKIKVRFNQVGGYEGFEKLFNLVQSSPFLIGENKNNWKASFDWLIENDTNYLKVIEGKYSSTSTTKQLLAR